MTSNHQLDIVFDNDGISILARLSCIGSITLELDLYRKKTLELDSLHGAKVVGSYTYPENHKKKSKANKENKNSRS